MRKTNRTLSGVAISCALVFSLIIGISASPAFAAYDEDESVVTTSGLQDASSSDGDATQDAVNDETTVEGEPVDPGENQPEDGVIDDDVVQDEEDDVQESNPGLGGILFDEASNILNNATTYFGRSLADAPKKSYEKMNYTGTKSWKDGGETLTNPVAGTVSSITIQLRGYVDWSNETIFCTDQDTVRTWYKPNRTDWTSNDLTIQHDRDGHVVSDLNDDNRVDDKDKFYDRNEDGLITSEGGTNEARDANAIVAPCVFKETVIDSSDGWKYDFGSLEKYFYEYEPVIDSNTGNPTGTFCFVTNNAGELARHKITYEVVEVEPASYEGEKNAYSLNPKGETVTYDSDAGTSYKEVVDFVNTYLGPTELKHDTVTFGGTKYWVGDGIDDRPDNVTIELRGCISDTSVRDGKRWLYETDENSNTNWDKPKEDLNGDGATNDFDKYFDVNGDGKLDDEDRVDGDFVEINLPSVYQQAIVSVDDDWAYQLAPVNKVYYDFEDVTNTVDGTEIKSFKPKKTDNDTFRTYAYSYDITEVPVEGYVSQVTSPRASESGVTKVDVYNHKLDKSGKIKILKSFKGPIYANGYIDENGKQQYNANNNVNAVFRIVGVKYADNDNRSGEELVVFDERRSIDFTSDQLGKQLEIIVDDLPLDAWYTITELNYPGSGYVQSSGPDSSMPFKLTAQEGDEVPAEFTFTFENVSSEESVPNQGWVNEYSKENGGFAIKPINRVVKLGESQ